MLTTVRTTSCVDSNLSFVPSIHGDSVMSTRKFILFSLKAQLTALQANSSSPRLESFHSSRVPLTSSRHRSPLSTRRKPDFSPCVRRLIGCPHLMRLHTARQSISESIRRSPDHPRAVGRTTSGAAQAAPTDAERRSGRQCGSAGGGVESAELRNGRTDKWATSPFRSVYADILTVVDRGDIRASIETIERPTANINCDEPDLGVIVRRRPLGVALVLSCRLIVGLATFFRRGVCLVV